MKLLKSACALLVFFSSVPGYATTITFATRPAFNAAAPGLPVETFESGLVAPGTITGCTGPLSSAAGSACFAVGTLLPGAIYSASPSGLLVLISAGFPPVGNASKVLGPSPFVDTFNISFTAATTAVGFDFFPGPAAGNVQISVFDPGSVSLGVFTLNAALGANFFGVVSTGDLIGRINITSMTALPGELIDNVAFGNAGATVPEPSSLVLLTSGLAMLIRLRRKIT
jgi:hypothetical protein